ncbi:transposase family protein [Streptomyces sp. W16]|uniref:transposase family protein n=1 Tax=Streptomyces sp. W16 TaxID=3076631 RepID=UPI003FA3549A
MSCSTIARTPLPSASSRPEPKPSQLASLADVLSRLPDPRRARSRRYRLGSLLALCLIAVRGGAASLAAIARFTADTDTYLREQLGLASSASNASMLGRPRHELSLPVGGMLSSARVAARTATAPIMTSVVYATSVINCRWGTRAWLGRLSWSSRLFRGFTACVVLAVTL